MKTLLTTVVALAVGGVLAWAWGRLRGKSDIHDLRSRCAKHVEETMGKECVPDFLDLYDKIGRGTPVSPLEAVAVIEIVEKIKKQMKEDGTWKD